MLKSAAAGGDLHHVTLHPHVTEQPQGGKKEERFQAKRANGTNWASACFTCLHYFPY